MARVEKAPATAAEPADGHEACRMLIGVIDRIGEHLRTSVKLFSRLNFL